MVPEMQTRAFGQGEEVEGSGGDVFTEGAWGKLKGGVFGRGFCEGGEEGGVDYVDLAGVGGE